jgi:hypothetical protein
MPRYKEMSIVGLTEWEELSVEFGSPMPYSGAGDAGVAGDAGR